MPVLSQPKGQDYVILPGQKARICGQTEVLVVGGGPAGMGAALGASKAGAQVILAERYGFLGGNATVALVMPLMSFHTQHRAASKQGTAYKLWPNDQGPGEPVIGGVVQEFLEKLFRADGAIRPSEETGYVVPFDPEVFKWIALQILDEAGVNLLFHAWASSISDLGPHKQVAFLTKSGPIVIRAKVVIDCTGDADAAVMAGADFELGRGDDQLQPMTLMFRMGEFDIQAFRDYVNGHPDQWRGVYGLWDLVKKAEANGDLDLPRDSILFFGTPHDREVSVNCTRVSGVSGINVWDLTRAEYESRRQMRQIEVFLKKYVPGFMRSYNIQSGVQIGVRETRRIRGGYTLTEEDVLFARKFPDAVARSTYPIDIHDPQGKGTTLKYLPAGEYYEIPLRCLIPESVENMLVAGRCISGTHEALSSYRIMPVSMATGQAAGVCAAIAAAKNVPVRELDYAVIKEELLKQNVKL